MNGRRGLFFLMAVWVMCLEGVDGRSMCTDGTILEPNELDRNTPCNYLTALTLQGGREIFMNVQHVYCKNRVRTWD